ncbi:MAG TPA: nitrilase-related carbon-nitrogen hydrolase, partial [Elusimicrobiota bacterium]|nr:nitrilase-related carbon-nitrogen hydrolase [Elusimicrobiota bacterium]
MKKTTEKPSLRISLAQINCAVGDLAGNAARILEYAEWAGRQEADVVVFPELSLTGYPPEDL